MPEQLLQENQIRDLKEFNSILYGIRNPSSEQGNSGQIIKIVNGEISIEHEFSEYVQLFSLCSFQSNLYVSVYPSGRIYKSNGVNTSSWSEVFNFGVHECEIRALTVFNNKIYASLQIIENGEYKGKIYSSVDGNTWSEVYSDATSPIFSLFVFDFNIYAGSKNKILRSSDGNTWSEVYSGSGDVYCFGEYLGKIFAGLSSPFKIISSLTGDTSTWSDENAPAITDYSITMVSASGKLFVGTIGYILAYDGVNWVNTELIEIAAVSSLVFGGILYFGTYNNATLIESDGESFIFNKLKEVVPSETVNITSSFFHIFIDLFENSVEIVEELISKAIYKRFEDEDVNIEENIRYKRSFTEISDATVEYILEDEPILIKTDTSQPIPQALVKIPKTEKVFIITKRGYRKIGFYEEWISESDTGYSILRKYGNQIGGYNWIGLFGETIQVFADSDKGILTKKEIKYILNGGQVRINEGEVEGITRDNRQNPDKIEVREGLMIKMPNMRSFEDVNIKEHVRIIRTNPYSRAYYDSNIGKFIVSMIVPEEAVNIEDSGCVMQWHPSFIVRTGYRDQFGALHITLNLVKGGREDSPPTKNNVVRAVGWDALGYYDKSDWLGNEIWEYYDGNNNKHETIWSTSPWRMKGKSCWDKDGSISGEIIASNIPIKVSIFDFFGQFVLFPTIQIVKDTIKIFEDIIKKGGWYYKVIDEDVEIGTKSNAFREHIKKVLDEIFVNIEESVTAAKGFVKIARAEKLWIFTKKAAVGIPTPIQYGDDYFLIFEEAFAYVDGLDVNGNVISRSINRSNVLGKFESKMRNEQVSIKMTGHIGLYVIGLIKKVSSNIEISSSAIWNFFLKEIVSSTINIYSEAKEKFESILIIKILEPIILEIYSEVLNKKTITELLEDIVDIISEAIHKKEIKEILEDFIDIISEALYRKAIKEILEDFIDIISETTYRKAIRQIVESRLNIQETLSRFIDFIRVVGENIKIFSLANLIQKTYTLIKEKGRMFVYETKKFFVYQTSKFRLRK